MKIMLGLPSRDLVHKSFTISLLNTAVMAFSSSIPLMVSDVRATDIVRGRNAIVRSARAQGCSHIFWIDSDMKFPADTLTKLLAHDKPIVGATYKMRMPPFTYTHKELEGESIEASLRKVRRLPGGMILVRTEVYEKLDMPWYKNIYEEDAINVTTQDYDFCDRARALGFDVWMDWALSTQVRHIGEAEY